jgi:hypothetical protein
VGALFKDLYDVAVVLTEHIREEVGITDVQPGPPRDVSASTEPGARITLLYTTPQPTHRNDPVERQPDGMTRPPPLSLSCFYLITTSGADGDDPIAAHSALGKIMTLYHDSPALQLPLSTIAGSPPGAFTDLGEGCLDVVQVPMVLEQIDKIWTSVEPPLQPWALYEVAPVQLISARPDIAPGELVRPGGIGLVVSTMASRPRVVRLTPTVVRRSGRLRVDLVPREPIDGLIVDDVQVPVGSASLIGPSDRGSLVLKLDAGGLEELGEGSHTLAVIARGMVSRREVFRIAAPAVPVLDALDALEHEFGTDLVLTGANLSGAVEAILWPDSGLVSPAEVHSLAVVDVTATSVTLPAAGSPIGLSALPGQRAPWRLAIRVDANVYTPFVLLEPPP